MSKANRLLADQRAARDRARAEFNRQLAQAKIDLAPAVLKRRIAAEVQKTSLSVAHQAIDIASDSRGIVAATVAALVLWLARKPIMAGAGKLWQRAQAPATPRERIKHLIAPYWRKLKEYADE